MLAQQLSKTSPTESPLRSIGAALGNPTGCPGHAGCSLGAGEHPLGFPPGVGAENKSVARALRAGDLKRLKCIAVWGVLGDK